MKYDWISILLALEKVDISISCQTFKTLFLSSKTLAVRDSVKKIRCKTAYLRYAPQTDKLCLKSSWWEVPTLLGRHA